MQRPGTTFIDPTGTGNWSLVATESPPTVADIEDRSSVIPYNCCQQTGISALSAIGVIVAIYKNSKQARLHGLFELISQQKLDPILVQAIHNVKMTYREGCSSAKFLDPESPERKDILLVLNLQEFMATGVHYHRFDEKIYKRMQYTNVVNLWEASEGFMAEHRALTKKPTVFQEFEALAKRWKDKPFVSYKQKSGILRILRK